MIWFSFLFLFCRFLWTDFALLSPEMFHENVFHRQCLGWISYRELMPLYGGLFCGSSEMDIQTKTLFQQTGLYHLLVVSGAHLVFLEKIVDRLLSGREKTKLAVFLIFSIVCQLNPPILRAFLSQVIRLVSNQKHLFLNEETRILLSGLWCLILFPQWILSTSLLLSWMASLALNYQMAAWKKHVLIALYLLPWTHTLSASAIFNNLIFGFIFEWLLFPASFACFLIPGLTTLGNTLWIWSCTALSWLPFTDVTIQANSSTNYWPYVFLIHLIHRVKR